MQAKRIREVTGVVDNGDGGRDVGAEPTGDKHNSSKSGVSMISIGNENVVSSVLVALGLTPLPLPALPTEFPLPPPAPSARAVIVAVTLVIGLDSRLPRPFVAPDTVRGVVDVGLGIGWS